MEKKIWKEPGLCKRLDESQVPLWFWNDKLENNEIEKQLKMKTEVGIKATIPHARTNMGEGYIGGYLDEDWFSKIKVVVDYKRKNNESMWLYDEIDWPAGTCNQTITLNERFREQYLKIDEIKLPAKEIFRGQLHELSGKSIYGIRSSDELTDYAFNISIVDEQSGQPYNIQDYFTYCMFGPEIEFKSDKDSRVYVTKIHVDPYEYGGNEQVSYINKEATKAFLKSTYDAYYNRFEKDFGKTIKYIFNDETRMCNSLPFSRDFALRFEKIKGYSLLPLLYKLICTDEEAGRVRCDYFDVLATLYQENFFGEIQSWCHEHHIGLFAHLLGEETLLGQVRYSGDYLRQNRYLDIVGADHLGKGIGSLNIKYTACGAHSYGIKKTAVEVFAGCGWDLTFDEYTRMITWLYQQGMQCIINHGFFYSDRGNRKNDWPPSQFFQWQGWPNIKKGNDMIRRLTYGMTDGINESQILIYNPIETFWQHYIPDQNFTHGFFMGGFTKSEKAAYIDMRMQYLMNGLLCNNLDFDIIHKDVISHFTIENKKIINTKSGQTFDVLVLPMCEVLPYEMVTLCEIFADNGGKIIALDTLPNKALEKNKDAEVLNSFITLKENKQIEVYNVNKLNNLFMKIKEDIQQPIIITKGTRSAVNNHPAYKSYLIDPYVHTGEDLSGVMFTKYLKDGKRNTLFMNYNNKVESIHVKVATTMVPEIWDTMTGEIYVPEILNQTVGFMEIKMEIPVNYGVFLVSDK